VVISADGFVVTNNHVLGDDVAEVTVTVGDRRDVKAKIIGVDAWTDVALLKIDATGLPTIPWGDSSKLKVAEWVMAVGNPYSLSQTVTLGIVSALGRANVGITAYEDFIQTDAAINPGNSGGALINSRGELIGINTAIFSQSGGYQGIGFAVPSNLVRRVVDDLTKYGQVRRGSIGTVEVSPLTSRLAEELRAPKTDGVVVTQMSRASAAYKAGMQPGDVILSVNGQPVTDPSQFLRMIADSPIGSTVRVEVLSDGKRSTLRIPVEAQSRPRRGR
jgi:serine protease Do